jgi:hypothetical protein
MIVCPNCRHGELEGTLFCNECGTQLVVVDRMATQSLKHVSTNALKSPFFNRLTGPFTTTGQLDTLISLHLLESGEVIQLSGKKEYGLGRAADGNTDVDVDLSRFEAYAQGVSRSHAILKVDSQRVYITDLGSSNGTRVNGQKISSNIDFPLNHGDLIALGKLKMQFLLSK